MFCVFILTNIVTIPRMIHLIEEFKSSTTLMTSGSQLNVCTVAFDDPLLASTLIYQLLLCGLVLLQV